MRLGFRLSLRSLPIVPKLGVLFLKFGDSFLPDCCSLCVGYDRVAIAEEFLFLNLDSLPRRIAEHGVKSTNPPCMRIVGLIALLRQTVDIWKREMPMEKVVLS